MYHSIMSNKLLLTAALPLCVLAIFFAFQSAEAEPVTKNVPVPPTNEVKQTQGTADTTEPSQNKIPSKYGCSHGKLHFDCPPSLGERVSDLEKRVTALEGTS